ncbi:uncharacterized protein LOC143825747 [Paroedura picta]|uniref:uncharacterized protein LOC143825747 n=1 Tax=Paroedura picta TaxID=143630 RepID=UPI004055ADCD
MEKRLFSGNIQQTSIVGWKEDLAETVELFGRCQNRCISLGKHSPAPSATFSLSLCARRGVGTPWIAHSPPSELHKQGQTECLLHTPQTLHLENTGRESSSLQEAAITMAMNHLLRLTFFSLLCLPALAWVIKKSTQNEPWKTLDQLSNRELFLAALQSYFNSKGIHVDGTVPDFISPLMERDLKGHRTQEERALATLEPNS